MIAWLAAFVFTQVVEIPIYLAALSRARGASKQPRDFFVAFGASAITHPLLWLLFPRTHTQHGYVVATAIAEIVVVIVEAGWLRLFGLRRALAWSFAANAASLSLGILSRALFGMP